MSLNKFMMIIHNEKYNSLYNNYSYTTVTQEKCIIKMNAYNYRYYIIIKVGLLFCVIICY